MAIQLKQIPALETGFMRATATVQDPIVTVSSQGCDSPTLCIEEAGVAVELEFPDPGSLNRFRQRIAALQWNETKEKHS